MPEVRLPHAPHPRPAPSATPREVGSFWTGWRWLGVAVLAWVVLFASAVAAVRFGTSGLIGRFYYGAEWRDAPRVVRVAPPPGGDWLTEAGRFGERAFSAQWTGWIAIERPGTYRFATTSDDGSWLYVDDVLVVDNGGDHAMLRRTGQVDLSPGPHRLRVDYQQWADGAGLEVQWAEGDDPFTPLPVERVFPSHFAAARGGRVVSHDLERWLTTTAGYVLATVLATVLLMSAGLWLLRRVARHVGEHANDAALNRWLWRLLVLAAGLILWESWYGIPIGPNGWEGDELRSLDVVPALDQWFSHGWYDLYSPMYFYVLGALTLPFRIVAQAGLDDLWTDRTMLTLSALYRGTAVLAGVACVYLTYRCAFEAFERRTTGLWAGFVVAVTPNVVYLSKLTKPDVPYVALFLLAMLYYLRSVRAPSPSTYRAFAAAAMASVCVKDQAYGLVVLPSLHLAWLRWRAIADTAVPARALAFVVDRSIAHALAAAAVVFAVGQNLFFNLSGFWAHVAYVTGSNTSGYRTYENTVRGLAELTRDSLLDVPWMFGWPVALCVAAGLALAWRERRRETMALLLPVVSYFVTFIWLVGYFYDRFYLGPAAVLAMFAGHALSTLMAHPASWVRTVALTTAVYTFALACSVNLLMMRDSRFAAERWLIEHVPPHATVGHFSQLAYLPRPGPLTFKAFGPDWSVVNAEAPEFLVVNTEYGRRVRFLDFYAPLFNGTHPNYRPVARFKSDPGPAFLLANDRVFWNGVEDSFTMLDKINPDIQVYVRRDVQLRDPR